MDTDLIYAKTPSGEEAMHQRTRVMQRNVRMVLILVDGQSSVADLCLKTGNQKLTENALHDLEKGGFIEPRLEQDSLWAESKKVAQEIREAAVNKAMQIASIPKVPESAPEPVSVPASEERVFVHSVFPVLAPVESPVPSVPPALSVADLVPEMNAAAAVSSAAGEVPVRRAEKRRKPAGPSLSDRFKTLLASRRKREDSVSIRPIRRGGENAMGWRGILASTGLGVIVLLIVSVYLFPYDHFLADAEGAFAQASGQPVRIGRMRVNLYPKPGLVLADVRIGSGRQEAHISEMRLLPEVGSLFAPKKLVHELVLSGVSLPAEFLVALPLVLAEAAKPAAKVGVRHIRFENTDISYGGLGFTGMEGEAVLTAESLLQALALRTADRSLTLTAKPADKRIDVTVEGFGWRVAPGSPFLFDSVNLKGDLENGFFTIRGMELRLFDGLIQGVAILQADKKKSISGDVRFERLNATRLGDAVGIGQQFTGETNGKIRFSASSDSWSDVFSDLVGEGDFSVRRGSVRGIDLAEAVRRVSGTPVQGGATIFEQLSGKIRMTPKNYQFTDLVLNSGLMQSTGQIDVNRDLQTSGRMDLKMRGTVNQTRVPISISGPLRSPLVQVGGR